MAKTNAQERKPIFVSSNEAEIINRFAQGRRAKEVAEEIGISRRIVEGKIRDVRRRVGAVNMAQLMHIVGANGIAVNQALEKA